VAWRFLALLCVIVVTQRFAEGTQRYAEVFAFSSRGLAVLGVALRYSCYAEIRRGFCFFFAWLSGSLRCFAL